MAELQGATAFVTGVAGFIGYHVAAALLDEGVRVYGVDNLNAYYAPALKRARIARLARDGFVFHEADVADHARLAAAPGADTADLVIHLAAQAGVRHSIDHPFDYASANLVGHLSALELARRSPRKPLTIYASSSAVYGANVKIPFAEDDPVTRPVSLYSATKRADELMSEAYARLYGLPLIGLRFFTVYGPWGRPDMAYWSFTENILAGRPIRVFNRGRLRRDFTYIDDIVDGVLRVAAGGIRGAGESSHRIYNIGHNRPVGLIDFIAEIEKAAGRAAIMEMAEMQPGDVVETAADITAIARDYGFEPRTPLEAGIPRFVEWYRSWRAGQAS